MRKGIKYIITESQNDRLKQLIKDVAETYTSRVVKKTEVEVEEAQDSTGMTYYILYPKFHIKGMKGPDFHMTRHLLAQFVEDVVGVPIHSASMRIAKSDSINESKIDSVVFRFLDGYLKDHSPEENTDLILYGRGKENVMVYDKNERLLILADSLKSLVQNMFNLSNPATKKVFRDYLESKGLIVKRFL